MPNSHTREHLVTTAVFKKLYNGSVAAYGWLSD